MARPAQSPTDTLKAHGATDDEADRILGAVKASATAMGTSLEQAFANLSEAVRVATESTLMMHEGLRRYGLLYGPLRYRKPYLKQPGVQFARYEYGGLRQYKRLVDGTVVKV